MQTLNTPYKKELSVLREILNPITKENPYYASTAVPRTSKIEGEKLDPIIIPNRQSRRMSHKYVQLVDGTRLKFHGSNRSNKLHGRTKRF